MASKKVLSIGILFFEVFLFLVTSCCFSQNQYQEIKICHSLVGKEACDSIYHKALTKYHTLPPPAASSALKEQLTTAISLPENTDIEVILKTATLPHTFDDNTTRAKYLYQHGSTDNI